MIALVSQLLTAGYTASNILNFLSNKIPQLQGNIQGAQKAGYSPEKILKYLSNNLKTDAQGQKVMSAGEKYLKSVGIKTSQERDETRNKYLKGALGVGAGVLGLYSGLNQARNFLTAAPTVGQVPPTGPAPIQATPNPMPPIGPAMGTTVPQPPPPQAAVVPPPQGAQASLPPQVPNAPQKFTGAADILEQFGLRKIAENLRAQGKEPEIISAVLAKSLKGEDRARFGELMKSGQVPPFQELVRQFINESPPAKVLKLPEDKGFKFGGLLEPVDAPIIKPEDYQVPEENRPAIKRGSLVIKPDGSIGEVKGEDKSGALVETNGKASKVPLDDLESEPEDVISITQDLLKIPEVDRSSVVSLFTYDPEERDMFIQYHNGETYRYLDVDPQKVMNVANKMGIPVTEGKNIFGAWSPEDKKSLGATLIQEFLKDPKYAKPKKGEPANPNYKKLETLYDYWEKLRRKPKKKS
jgi:hypothetical protein